MTTVGCGKDLRGGPRSGWIERDTGKRWGSLTTWGPKRNDALDPLLCGGDDSWGNPPGELPLILLCEDCMRLEGYLW